MQGDLKDIPLFVVISLFFSLPLLRADVGLSLFLSVCLLLSFLPRSLSLSPVNFHLFPLTSPPLFLLPRDDDGPQCSE